MNPDRPGANMEFLLDERVKPVILIVFLSICYLAVHRYFVRAATPNKDPVNKAE